MWIILQQIGSYTTDNVNETGYSLPQTFNTENPTTTKWQVLDNSNEVLTLISETPLHTGAKLYFGTFGTDNKGAIAYSNYETVLNKMCEDLYSKSGVGTARSMTFTDVAKVTGWSIVPHNDTWAQYLGYSDYADYSQGHSLTNTYRPDYNNGALVDSSSHTFYNTWEYFIMKDAISQFGIDPSSEIKNMIFGSSSDFAYYLVSCAVICDASSALFTVGNVNHGGSCSGDWTLFYGTGKSDWQASNVRPAVVLNSNVQIEQRAGTSANPHHIL